MEREGERGIWFSFPRRARTVSLPADDGTFISVICLSHPLLEMQQIEQRDILDIADR